MDENIQNRGPCYTSLNYSKYDIRNSDLAFFRLQNEEMGCREWLSHSERLDLRSPMDVYKSFRLCGAQFSPSQFMSQDKRKLIHNAVPSTIFSCTNPCSGLPELAPGPHPPPVDCRKMTEEAAGKGEPVWMQSHVAHAASVSGAVTAPPAHLPAAPCAPAPDPTMSLFPRQMQLSAQPITELKLFMHPKPTMHPHLSQFSYIFQERPPGKPPGKGDPTQVFWVKPDQNNVQQAAMPGVKEKINEKEMTSSENHEGDSPSLPGMSTPNRPPRPHSAERQYKCKDCGKAFPQPSHLIRHTRTHTGEQPYKCDLCGRAFSDQSHRLRHLRTHIGVRTHKCEECGKEFFEPNHLVRHARRHTGERPYPCDQCGKAFCEQSGLNRHLRTHSGERPYKCELCGRAFPQRSELTRHLGTHSSSGDPGSPAESTSSAGQPSTSTDTRKPPEETSQLQKPTEPAWMQGPVAHPTPGLSCPPPHFLAPLVAGPDPSMPFFPSQMQLGSQPLAEVKLVMTPKPSMHPHLSQLSYMLQGSKGQTGKPDPAHLFWVKPTEQDAARAQAAAAAAAHQQTQQNHAQNAQPPQQQQQNHHGTPGQNHHSPQNHQSPSAPGHPPPQVSPSKSKGSGKSHHSCSSKSSEGISSASSTIGRHRNGRDPLDEFRCKDCGKIFSQPHHLIRHRRIHTGEQPFKCEMCGKTFSDESHRLRHMRTHIGVRKHRCEECGKEFFERNQLMRHYRRHRGDRPWRCLQCDKTFCEESGLKKHMQTHSTDRPYQCDYCSRSFFQRSELQRHAASHTGEKMFKCEVCEKSFTDRHALNKHLSTHMNMSQSHRCQVLWSSFHPGQ